jgi:rare lipoprotein A
MKCIHLSVLILLISSAMLGCARTAATVKNECGRPYQVFGKTYHPLKAVQPGYTQKGIASWYGPGFHGKKTSSGEVYDMRQLTAAHSTLPLHTLVKVTNLENHREVVVRINDRGPFVGDRVLDLSLGAATKIGMVKDGIVPVKLAVLGPGNSRLAAKPTVSRPEPKSEKPRNPFFSGPRRWLASLWGP